ncbi:hypothetical protein QYE76_062135 [Lolium multiflorum]|uniref:Uncharacterized protein n=1 Tax=Lolium multiflorum TaxID=4521 RepID=A0AAD8W6Z7_LOLMU|nr:hypothetical protein QYE76_062135 [Lolium multiflorum]
MSSGQPSATIAATSEIPPASTADAHVAPGAEPPPFLSPAELSAAVRDLTMAIANMRTFLQVTHGLPAAVSAPPPPPPPPPAPSAPPPPAPAANQGVPITNIKWPASPSQRPSWVDAPVFTPAPAQPTVPPPPAHAAPSPFAAQQPPRYTKLEFTTYDGATDPLNWLNQCEQFFRGQRTLASDRTWIASYHLRGAAQTWYYALEQDEGGMPPWERFRDLCLLRFGPPVRGSRLAELGRLQFTSSVQDFADRFQSLACHAPGVSARQRAQLFVGGLPDHIRVDVEMREPQDLQTAMYYARAYEQRTLAIQQSFQGRGARPPPRPAQTAPARPALPAAATTPAAPTRPFRRLTTAEQLERRRKGLCFNCDERATTYGPVDAKAFVVSLHALAGIKTAKTMLLPVTISGERLTALVDTEPSGDEHFSVTVANGDRLACQGVARQVPITIGDEHFSVDCVGINLGCYDFILGIDFLSTLGPILWDFEALPSSSARGRPPRPWRGLGSSGPPAPQLALMAAALDPTHPLLDDLLQQHSDIFTEPQGLPPARACDHRIHLLPGTPPVAVRPYRYPQLQKDELERQVVVMMAQGIIRISTSPFSAPVLLVRKPDGTWRFCIDYRALNAVTSKDKFPNTGHASSPSSTCARPTTSASWAEHLQHVAIVFNELRAHRLHLKRSKCSFGTTSVTYLGHVITAEGVAMDADKVAAVATWPTPQSPRALRGFLGLAGYYRKYIRDFGLIAAPLTRLLRRDAFAWDAEATEAFQALQRALTTGPVLQMPDFDLPFVVDCDASGIGFGAVLHQGEGPLAFFSRPFATRHLKLTAYERELIGLVQAVRHWRPYLWGRTFRVRTDHYSLKFLLDQRLSTVPQHQWISKLFGFDFTVEYRPGRLNTVADALSRRDTEELADSLDGGGVVMCIRSGPSFAFIDDIRRATVGAADAQALRQRLDAGELAAPWHLADGLLLHGRRIFVPDQDDLRQQALCLAHSAGHEGVQKTLKRLRDDFYIPGDGALVRDLVGSCVTCQRNKTETLRPAGLLQPLDVPSQVWADISMDFIEGLPKVGGKSVILTVVDRFSKYAHFIPLGHPYTAASVARAFFDGIVRLHGFPSSIVSDRDPVFTGHVWRDLFRLAGVKLRMSTAFHPQTDGQSEVVNKIIAMYLRCVTGDRPRAWVDWLAWAEYCYNTSYHSALHATPFEVVYGRPPPRMLPYESGSARSETAGDLLRTRDEILAEARQRLLQAQQLARKYYDAHHRDAEFAVGDWVWLRLLHRTAQSLDPRAKHKLGPRYAGPFRVLERVGTLAYRLELPVGSRLHDVFHVSLLKAHKGDPPAEAPVLPPHDDGRVLPGPEKVLKPQLRRGAWHILVQWAGLPSEDATWEKLEEFQQHFPDVQLEDELFEKAGRDVMVAHEVTELASG